LRKRCSNAQHPIGTSFLDAYKNSAEFTAMLQLYPILFQPNLHPTIWGGNRLKSLKGIAADDEPIGESWEVSAVPSSVSIIANGSFAGRSLSDVVNEYPQEILGEHVSKQYGNQFPLLVKFIDAEKDLSIQVHPDDAMAQREHGKTGKSEMWYIIAAKPGAYLYTGFKEEITPNEYKRRVEDGSIIDVLARHEVKAGDVFYLPAGRVHAICGGILLAEIQQSSDITYRIFDYNRCDTNGKPRELHTELAAKALNFNVEQEYRTQYNARKNEACQIANTPHFTVNMIELDSPIHRNLQELDSFIIYMCVKGGCNICVRKTGEKIQLSTGSACLVPAAISDCDIAPNTSSACCILETFICKEM